MTAVVTHDVDHSALALGRRQKRIDPNTLRAARYLTAPADAPATFDAYTGVRVWPMYDNDQFGCCTFAGAGHAVQGWRHYGQGRTLTLATSAIVRGYEDVTEAEGARFDPATGANDNGCVELDVLNYWRRTGVGRHHITAYAEVDASNPQQVRAAIAAAGGLYLGIELATAQQRETIWLADGEPGSWGGHCVWAAGYDADYVYVITWGKVLRVAWAFITDPARTPEAYLLISPDYIGKRTGQTPGGLTVVQLEDDAAQLTGHRVQVAA